MHAGWRAGWLGRLLRIHSPSGELLGTCWCQRRRFSLKCALWHAHEWATYTRAEDVSFGYTVRRCTRCGSTEYRPGYTP